jgi:hypothetical protein
MSIKRFLSPIGARQIVLTIPFLLTGASLLAYILFGFSMGLALTITFLLIAAVLFLRLYNLAPPRRADLIRTIRKGVVIGLLATAAYDIVRLLIVWAFSMHVNPFKAFPYFGYAIAGEGIARESAIAIGAVYHAVNGIFFSISYCLLFRGRHWICGILWALGLEALMFSVYPSWLNLDAVLAEFTIVSVTGHLAYGAVLGVMGRTPKFGLD